MSVDMDPASNGGDGRYLRAVRPEFPPSRDPLSKGLKEASKKTAGWFADITWDNVRRDPIVKALEKTIYWHEAYWTVAHSYSDYYNRVVYPNIDDLDGRMSALDKTEFPSDPIIDLYSCKPVISTYAAGRSTAYVFDQDPLVRHELPRQHNVDIPAGTAFEDVGKYFPFPGWQHFLAANSDGVRLAQYCFNPNLNADTTMPPGITKGTLNAFCWPGGGNDHRMMPDPSGGFWDVFVMDKRTAPELVKYWWAYGTPPNDHFGRTDWYCRSKTEVWATDSEYYSTTNPNWTFEDRLRIGPFGNGGNWLRDHHTNRDVKYKATLDYLDDPNQTWWSLRNVTHSQEYQVYHGKHIPMVWNANKLKWEVWDYSGKQPTQGFWAHYELYPTPLVHRFPHLNIVPPTGPPYLPIPYVLKEFYEHEKVLIETYSKPPTDHPDIPAFSDRDQVEINEFFRNFNYFGAIDWGSYSGYQTNLPPFFDSGPGFLYVATKNLKSVDTSKLSAVQKYIAQHFTRFFPSKYWWYIYDQSNICFYDNHSKQGSFFTGDVRWSDYFGKDPNFMNNALKKRPPIQAIMAMHMMAFWPWPEVQQMDYWQKKDKLNRSNFLMYREVVVDNLMVNGNLGWEYLADDLKQALTEEFQRSPYFARSQDPKDAEYKPGWTRRVFHFNCPENPPGGEGLINEYSRMDEEFANLLQDELDSQHDSGNSWVGGTAVWGSTRDGRVLEPPEIVRGDPSRGQGVLWKNFWSKGIYRLYCFGERVPKNRRLCDDADPTCVDSTSQFDDQHMSSFFGTFYWYQPWSGCYTNFDNEYDLVLDYFPARGIKFYWWKRVLGPLWKKLLARIFKMQGVPYSRLNWVKKDGVWQVAGTKNTEEMSDSNIGDFVWRNAFNAFGGTKRMWAVMCDRIVNIIFAPEHLNLFWGVPSDKEEDRFEHATETVLRFFNVPQFPQTVNEPPYSELKKQFGLVKNWVSKLCFLQMKHVFYFSRQRSNLRFFLFSVYRFGEL